MYYFDLNQNQTKLGVRIKESEFLWTKAYKFTFLKHPECPLYAIQFEKHDLTPLLFTNNYTLKLSIS